MGHYAQLLAGVLTQVPELERGHWYPVITIGPDGLVQVMGPGGIECTLSEEFFRIIDHEPNKITRVPRDTAYQPDVPGDFPSGISAYGICPKGHKIEPLPGDPRAKCRDCALVCEVEDEHRPIW